LRSKRYFIVIGGLILFSGCQAILPENGTQMEATSSPTPISTLPGEIMPITPFLPTPSEPSPQGLVERTKADLATRLSISAYEISLIELAETEWSDSSLGCPQPGMNYLQVITPGYRIVFQVNDQVYEYHSDKNTAFIYCADQIPPAIPKS
jgi:hypothetical protein